MASAVPSQVPGTRFPGEHTGSMVLKGTNGYAEVEPGNLKGPHAKRQLRAADGET